METGYSVSKIADPPTISLTDVAIREPIRCTLTNETLTEPPPPPLLFITPSKNLIMNSVFPDMFNRNKNNNGLSNLYGLEIKRKNSYKTKFINTPSLPPLRHTFKSRNKE